MSAEYEMAEALGAYVDEHETTKRKLLAAEAQVERYREVVTFALGVLRSSTMTWEQRGAVTYDALATYDNGGN